MVKNTRAVLCIAHVPNYFGANRSLLTSIETFQEMGLSPYVVCPREGELSDVLKEKQIELLAAPLPWWFEKKRTFKWRDAVSAARSILDHPRFVPPSLVYTNSLVTPVGLLVSRKAGCPHLWHIREFGKEDYGLTPSVPAGTVEKVLSKSRCIFNSKAVASKFSSVQGEVIYNCVEIPPDFPEHTGSCERIGVIGHLHQEKGQRDLLQFFERFHTQLPPFELQIIGDGERNYVEECRRFVERSPIRERVHFCGYLGDVHERLQKLDVVIVPSRMEAFGRVTAEAMGAGRVVIGRNSGGTPELIRHGETGFLYNSEEELFKLVSMLHESPELVRRVSQEARAFAELQFSRGVFQDRLRALLQSFSPGRLA